MSLSIDPFSKEEIPDTLYKYRNFYLDIGRNKSHFDNLLNGDFYFSSPRNFNDPFDCSIPVNYREFVDNPSAIKEYIKMGMIKYPEYFQHEGFSDLVAKVLAANTLTNLEFIDNHTFEMQEELKNDIGIFSATIKNDNILMWSHYANAHTGFCFGFDTQKLMTALTLESIGKVTYSENYPLVSPLDEGLNQLRQQLLYKALDWQYENEYRIILMHKADKVVKFPLTCINEIYLGLCISEENKAALLNVRGSHFPHVKFYQMKKSVNEFRLVPAEI